MTWQDKPLSQVVLDDPVDDVEYAARAEAISRRAEEQAYTRTRVTVYLTDGTAILPARYVFADLGAGVWLTKEASPDVRRFYPMHQIRSIVEQKVGY